ncbi:MAG: Glu/Leu/Phe/Val dehydrogenase [Deltaproteobacteria bacterium]|nr:Glu/Leu/Phe/Val dehydrogenase [Deltaproteobacteria bacterium]
MGIFDRMAAKDHEQVIFCHDQAAGLRAIIAIHNTTLGPAIGGTRMWTFSSEDEALEDVLRLSRGMTYKAAAAGLNLGGGKAVIIGDPKKDKSEVLFRSFGRFVHGLGGRYLTAEDVGTNVHDMELVRMETSHVTGVSRALGGSGDPGPVTALGIYEGMKACVSRVMGRQGLEGLTVAVQGVGQVGYHVCQHLHREGARIIVADLDPDAVQRVEEDFEVQVVSPPEIYAAPCDIFAPCALGGVLNDETIPRLQCAMIAGAANNVLLDEERHAGLLAKRGILYAPDYVINAGGLINVANELDGYNRERAIQQAAGIGEILTRIFDLAEKERVTTLQAANTLAERRIEQIGRIKNYFAGGDAVRRWK